MADIGGGQDKAEAGVAGLDDVLSGGFARGHVFLVEGEPGTGKTTLATQFLRAGAARGETGLYFTLSETEAELRRGAASHGWALEPAITVKEVVPPDDLIDASAEQSLLYSSDLELGELFRAMIAVFEALRPARVVIDSLSEIRLLAQSSLRYRRQILALKHFLAGRDATVLLLDDLTAEANDKTVHSIVHGVIQMEQRAPQYGTVRRRLQVLKYRGEAFRAGYHDFTILRGGLAVFPRLVAAEHRRAFARTNLSSGIAAFDALLGGGVERGSSTLVLGPAGTGKTTMALQFAVSAMARGSRAVIFMFDEELGLFLHRMRAMGFDLEPLRDSGQLTIDQVDAAELSPGEFSHRLRHRVTESGADTVIIDSLNGYQAAMPEENALMLHMHELLQYLNRQGATTFLTVAQHGLVGEARAPVDLTYLADTVMLLRFFEAEGRMRRALSVVKKRTGLHEDTIREYHMGQGGISVGAALTGFVGVMRGLPAQTRAADREAGHS